jgi:sugar lactone lactonase YvrE
MNLRALLSSVVALLVGATLTSCGGSSATGPTTGAAAKYEGVLAGGTGENGVLTITVAATTSAPSLSYGAPHADAAHGGASSASNATGTITFVGGGGTVNVTGTLDRSTGSLSVAGNGYTFTGSLVNGVLGGNYVGPNGSGLFATLTSATTSVLKFCGTYSGVDSNNPAFHFHGIWDLSLVGSTFAGAGVSVTPDPHPTFLLRGTLQGTTITLTASKDGVVTGTETGTLSGNTVSGGTAYETWQGSTDACHGTTPAAFYVANFTGNSITVYAADATGNPSPTVSIAGNNTGLNGPIGLARDAAGRLYVANDNGDSITIYPAGAMGDAAPTTTIAGSSTGLNGPAGLALDASGQLFVGNLNNNSITIYAAGATGNVAPTATIAGASTGLNFPAGIALDAAGQLYVANLGSDAVTVYSAGATGDAAPRATIAGPNTGLHGPAGIAFDVASRLYVVENGSNSITVFAAGAAGDATPLTTVVGSNTGLSKPVGIAVDGAGRIYVANFGSGNPSIVIYAAGADGNATPAALIAGSNTGLAQPQFITF